MRGKSRVEREFLDAESLVGQLVPEGSVFAFLAEHRRELFPESFIADLFTSGTGRPSLQADLIGSVLVLKELYDLSDPQTAEAVRFDLRWKVACGRSLTETSFDPSMLVYWRKRIAKSQHPDRVFEAVDRVVAETGCCAGGASGCGLGYSTTRWPPRIRSPCWWRRCARSPGWCPARGRRWRGSRGWITPSRASRTSIGTMSRRNGRWCRTWSMTRWRCWGSYAAARGRA